MSASNGYQFALNQSGTSNVSWTVDDAPGGPQNIGNANTSNIYPVPGTCVERTITVRYFWNNRWYICCRKVFLCNPVQCTGEINSNWIAGGQITLGVNASYQNVQWKLNSGTVLGNGNNITIPNPGSNSTVCVFYRDAANTWRICCKDIGTPPNPSSDLTFDIDDNVCAGANTVVQVPVKVRNFNNVTTFQMSIDIGNGQVAQLQSIQSGSLPGTGNYPVLSSTNGALLWFNSTPVTVPDNTVICTLNILLTGNTSNTSTLNFSDNPTQIDAAQSIGGVSTPVTPIVLAGSVCIASNISISGKIVREDNLGIGNVTVQLSGGSTQTTLTDNAGNYTFSSLTAGGNYQITPVKNINYKNGVNGGDLVTIQKHILGLSSFTSPLRRISADADNSKLINGGDLVAIQRLILGLDLTLPLNNSWRFVDKKYVFPLPNNPWSPAYPEVLSYNNLNTTIPDADFTGIKIADADLTNTPGNIIDVIAADRLPNGLELEFDNSVLTGNSLSIPLRVSSPYDLESFQFTIQFDPAVMQFRTATGSEHTLTFGAENMNSTAAENGYLTFVWAASNGLPTPLSKGDHLLWLEFDIAENAASNIRVQDILQLNGKITPAIATAHGGMEQRVTLQSKDPNPASLRCFVVPNPFSETAQLHLYLPEAQTVDFALHALAGNLILSQRYVLPSGHSTIPISCDNCKDSQLLLYQLQTGHEYHTGKLLFLKQ